MLNRTATIEDITNMLRGIDGVISSLQGIGKLTPFDNSGERIDTDVFSVHAYDWSECTCGFDWDGEVEKCTCGHKEQTWNFKCSDFEVRWYKRLGRGMRMNRDITTYELNVMYKECVESLLDMKWKQ